MDVKKNLYLKCLEFVNLKLKTVDKTIGEIQKALNSETKSSAGDKHETGRAMLQLEREKMGEQLAEIQKTKEILSRIDLEKKSEIVCLGTVVYTSLSNYFISISAGALEVNSEAFYAISSKTPIGQLLLSKSVGDQVIFRDKKIIIEKIL